VTRGGSEYAAVGGVIVVAAAIGQRTVERRELGVPGRTLGSRGARSTGFGGEPRYQRERAAGGSGRLAQIRVESGDPPRRGGRPARPDDAAGAGGADRSAGRFQGARCGGRSEKASRRRPSERRRPATSPMGTGETSMRKFALWTFAVAWLAPAALPQDPQRVTVAFSDPARPKKLVVDMSFGSVSVHGYGGQEVIVETSNRAGIRAPGRREAEPPPGMHRIG